MANASNKGQSDRAAAERRIAALETRRAKQLLAGYIDQVDETDSVIAAEKRAIAILAERDAALARGQRKQERQDRESDRAAAIKVITPILDQRTVWATELQEALKRVVVLHDQINDTKQLRNAWPFATPEYFPWQVYDLGAEILRTLRDSGGYSLLPGAVRQAIAQGGSGFTQAPSDGPRGPDDLPGKVAANAAHIVKALSTINIHPAEPADTDVRAA